MSHNKAVLTDEQIDRIARSYFAEEYGQQQVKNAIHDAFQEATVLASADNPSTAGADICRDCGIRRPLHLLTCSVAEKGMAEGKNKEASEPLRQLLIDLSNNTYFCGLHLGDDAKYAGFLAEAEKAEQGLIELFEQVAAPVAQSTAGAAIPEVLLDGKAVYDELLGRSSRTSAENVSDVLDAVVRLMRRAAPVVQSMPVAWMQDDRKQCTTAESKRQMETAGFGRWAQIAALYTIPLYEVAPVAQSTAGAVQAPTLIPKWAGYFHSYQDWVNKAQSRLASPDHRRAMCVDARGRRCASGKDFMVARDEGTFPVRYFWECELAAPALNPSEVPDPIRELIAQHAEMLEENAYTYFELAYTRRTEWMAWLCSNHREADPDRKVLARGQGSTPEEACESAISALRTASKEGDQAAAKGDAS